MKRTILKIINSSFSGSPSHNIIDKKHYLNRSTKKLNETTKFLEKKKDYVFIIGGGPSLINFDLSFLENEDVICVNNAINLVKDPKYFITMDYSFFSKINESIDSIVSKAKSSHFIINRQHKYVQNINGVYTDTRFNLKYEGLEKFSSVISSYKEIDHTTGFGTNIHNFCHGENSGYCAIQFAILAGYKKIYLLGFDLEKNHNQKTHFHNSYKGVNSNIFYRNLNKYKKFILTSLDKIKSHNSIKFYTLTPSALEPTIPRITVNRFIKNKSNANLTDVNKMAKNNNLNDLVIVAYYTINTPYEEEAKKLIASLNKLGLNHDVVGVPNLGNWQANTRFKAKFMEDMLNKHKGKNLLYVDSDAIVHSLPVLFHNYQADIAVRWQDFRWRQNECLSGTIFMANNEKTRELCRRWQRVNVNEGPNATTFEQWNLGTVIKQMEGEGRIVAKNLPPEYTMIFDSMRAMYPNVIPVIEHFQASRRFRSKI